MATEEDKQAARDRLAELTGRYETAETQLEQVRKEVTDEIAAILMARTLGPSEVTRLSPFERQHVGRIAKAAGVPPLREATVVSRAKVAAKAPRSAVATPRQQVTETLPPPAKPRRRVWEPREGRPLTDEEAQILAERVRSRATELQRRGLEQDVEQVPDSLKDFTWVSAGMSMGLLTHDEVYATAEPQRPVSSEEQHG